MTGIERLHDIMTRLRDPERGCPWDREQTLESLKPCLLEETHELLAAMDRPEDKANYVEELGDVLLQVMFQCVMAEQEGRFSFDDVANAISDKLVHRHPHVFGNVDAKDSATVLRNWEQIKQMEHKKEARHSALDGVPAALPALLKAQRTQGLTFFYNTSITYKLSFKVDEYDFVDFFKNFVDFQNRLFDFDSKLDLCDIFVLNASFGLECSFSGFWHCFLKCIFDFVTCFFNSFIF